METSPSAPLPDDRLQDLNESICIIATKVFSSCKDKDCLADVNVPIFLGAPPYVLVNISFGKAVITNKTITFINDGNNLSRVEFDIAVSYIINYTADGVKQPPLSGVLNLGHKDILMYVPISSNMNEADYNLIVETYTKVLDGPKISDNTFVFTVGLYEIFKIVKDVQLFIPTFGYCPIPTNYVPYIPPMSICDKFMKNKFLPGDFYPEDYPRIYPPDIIHSDSEPEDPNHAVVHIQLTIDRNSIYVIIIEVVITRAGSGNEDYYYAYDEYDNSSGDTPLTIDQNYVIDIVPPKNPGDTQEVNVYGSYME